MSFINIIVLIKYYIVSNLFAKRNKRFAKHLLICKYKRRLYINFLMHLFLSLKHFRDYVDIDNNVKINDKTKIDII